MTRRLRRLGTLAVTAATLVALAVPSVASAEPGDLDGAYGICGFLPYQDAVPAHLTASGTKVLELTVAVTTGADGAPRSRYTITRRLRNGTLDSSFGTGGRTTVVLRSYANEDGEAMSVDDQGRVVLALVVERPAGSFTHDTWLVRLTAHGALDTTFGTGGRVDLHLHRFLFSVAAGGDLYGVATPHENDIVPVPLHVTSDGTVDPAFALELPTATFPNVTAKSVLSLPDGDLVGVASDTTVGGTTQRVLRWNANGSLDTAFTPLAPPTIARVGVSINALAAIPDSSDVIVTFREYWASKQPLPYLVARVRPDGTYEPTFGFNGVTPIEVDRDFVDLDVRASGITVVGRTVGTSTKPPRIVHLTPDGALDPAYGVGGVSDPGGEEKILEAFGSDGVSYLTMFTFTFQSDVGIATQLEWDLAKVSNRPLRAGAGLVLDWSGDAWPTRFGSDPGPECPYDTPYWADDDLARGITAVAGRGGYVADAFGGVHPFSVGLQRAKPAAATNVAYWPGWDIVRGIAARADGKGGYTLDAYGALHPFSTTNAPAPTQPVNGPYWPGWDIARGVALMPTGDRGYLLDGFGGLHPFSRPGAPRPPAVHTSGYWPGWDIARGVGILPDGTGGYVVDAFGGVHPFGIGNHAAPNPPGSNDLYFAGEDWVRGFTFVQPTVLTGANTHAGTTATPVERAPRDRTPGTAPPPR